jgi:antitoxin PrlF
MRARATITSKGQITLPIAIRHRMNLREGDVVEFTLEAGVTTLQRQTEDTNPFEKWAGRLGGLRQIQDAVDWQRDLRDEA